MQEHARQQNGCTGIQGTEYGRHIQASNLSGQNIERIARNVPGCIQEYQRSDMPIRPMQLMVGSCEEEQNG